MEEKNNGRLADRILVALQLSIEQEDKIISEILGNALEMALTRNAGGKDFVERRDLSDDVQKVLAQVEHLRKS